MKFNILDIGGKVVKEDDKYIVKDNQMLKNLVVSSTDLKPGKSTSGHAHPGQEEVYSFIKGFNRGYHILTCHTICHIKNFFRS